MDKAKMKHGEKKKKSTTATSSSTSASTSAAKGSALNDLFIIVFGIAFLLSLGINILYTLGRMDDLPQQVQSNTMIHQATNDFKDLKHTENRKKEPNLPMDHEIDNHEEEDGYHNNNAVVVSSSKKNNNAADSISTTTSIANLNCQPYGGPMSSEQVEEMVYWKDIPSDAYYQSPFFVSSDSNTDNEKFLTFEPDGGGWNNIRMAMESTIGLAIAMGRTLVMPPQKKMYLLGKADNKQQKHFSFVDFFPIFEMAQEHIGFKVMSMEEYLQTQGLQGKLKNKFTGKVSFPPYNRTNWDGIDQKEYDLLREYLRNVTITPEWKPSKCLPAFPSSSSSTADVSSLQNLVQKARLVIPEGTPPVNVMDPNNTLARLEETLSGRKELCIYTPELQQTKGLHFQCNHKMKLRMLVHFYAFLFFEDWKEDLWMKRFIRDHVRYIDEIQCAAARVVAGIRDHVRQRTGGTDPAGTFDTFHIRRGDFQFKTTRIPAEEIYQNSKNELTPNTTIFIATDERDKSFFDPLKQHYDVLFLDDFVHVLKGVNTNYYGMIDQLIASKGRIFFGCWFSTFTGYINRLRGYHSTKLQLPGYENGELPTTYYYATIDRKFVMHQYSALRGGFFNREFPTAWRDLDKGIGLIGNNGQ